MNDLKHNMTEGWLFSEKDYDTIAKILDGVQPQCAGELLENKDTFSAMEGKDHTEFSKRKYIL